MKSPTTGSFGQLFAWFWLAAFLFLALTGTTVKAPHPAVFPLLVASGFAWALTARRDGLLELWHEHRAIWVSLAVLVVSIAVAEVLAHFRGVPGLADFLPIPVWVVLCLPTLTLALQDATRMRWTIVLFAAICVWHFFTMPIEAVTGVRMSWQPVWLFPREIGPLKFQAAGLAWQAYYFTGLFLPLFYLAWGPWSEGRVMRWPQLPKIAWPLLAMAWGLPAVCVQSRSAFAGTLAAGLLALVAWRRPRQARTWIGLGVLIVIGAIAYMWLFSANKSGMDLRWAYYKLYFAQAWHWPEFVVGHGFTLVPNAAMFAEGFIPLEHSHNDLIQTLYSWGAVALVAYLAFWVVLIRLVWRSFVLRGSYWPVCAMLVFIPTTMTDLGFQHFEKAVFMVLLASWCMVFAREMDCGSSPP